VAKKPYIKPEITRTVLDNAITLLMLTAPHDPPPRGGGMKGNNNNDPFKSPFGDKPFG
jgi:hypothetical protein